jgi:hypothetical protein
MSGRVDPQDHGEWRSGRPRAAQFASRVPRRGPVGHTEVHTPPPDTIFEVRPRPRRSASSADPSRTPYRAERSDQAHRRTAARTQLPGPAAQRRRKIGRQGRESRDERGTRGEVDAGHCRFERREDPRGSRRVLWHVRFVDGTRATVTATAPGSAPQPRRSAAAATGVGATRSVAPGPDGVSTGDEAA